MENKGLRIWVVSMTAIMLAAMCALPASPAAAEPVTTLTISEPKHGTSPVFITSHTEFTLAGSGDIWYRWNSHEYTEYTGPFTAAIYMTTDSLAPPLPMDLEEGPHTLYYYATGEAIRSLEVHVDNLYPVTTLQMSGANYTGAYTYITGDTAIRLTAAEQGSGLDGIYYRLDQDPFTAYITPLRLSGGGIRTLTYHSIDNLGNKEPDKTLNLFLDNEPPQVDIVPGSPSVDASGTLYIGPGTSVSITAYDSSGVSSITYRIGAGAWTPYLSPFTITSEGQHIITARATDNLGHASPEVTLTLRVDATPPAVTVPGSSPGSISVRRGGSLTILCSDTGAGGCTIHYSLDRGSTWQVYETPLIFEENANLSYYARDSVGNEAERVTLAVIVPSQVHWRLYLGVALIAGGVLLGLVAFLMGRRRKSDSPEEGPVEENSESREKKEPPQNPKNRKRNP